MLGRQRKHQREDVSRPHRSDFAWRPSRRHVQGQNRSNPERPYRKAPDRKIGVWPIHQILKTVDVDSPSAEYRRVSQRTEEAQSPQQLGGLHPFHDHPGLCSRWLVTLMKACLRELALVEKRNTCERILFSRNSVTRYANGKGSPTGLPSV